MRRQEEGISIWQEQFPEGAVLLSVQPLNKDVLLVLVSDHHCVTF